MTSYTDQAVGPPGDDQGPRADEDGGVAEPLVTAHRFQRKAVKPSHRQLQVLRVLMETGSQQRAADELGIGYQTIKNHLSELYKRLTLIEGHYINSAYAAAYVLWLRELWEKRPNSMYQSPIVLLTIDGEEFDVRPAGRDRRVTLE